MTHVATLISSPAAPALTPDAIAAARDRLGPGETVLLAPGVAADLHFAPVAGSDGEADLRAALAGLPLDIVVQPVEGRRKRLLIADMDSTMIGQECIDELAAEIGIKDHVAAITERAMRGELAFEPALRERVGLLAGIDAGVVERIIGTRITLTPGGRELVRTMRAHGAYTALVSGGFTVFTGPIAGKIGFDENRANTLLAEDGRLVGRVAEPILGADAKLASLHEIATARAIPLALTLAVGDGANDLPMLQAAGLGVAYRAKPKVAAAAAARIEHADLTALLYLQGYRHSDFVAA
ncbi:phosphoserine phosphatase [Prosthecomicrobium hirschii]|uniref:Phosphoserine phosphatase n=1 Tax=Prosthecodimorpha hirschii TaxID=665126 RepID=A0A0P6VJX3_9HYPH|nr:phosphoserine phosphatase SerB [Prosthecomicrobium hirschii]KPL51403.1 phosphoserine phosphatase [Prosthecomicrobium hirschii]